MSNIFASITQRHRYAIKRFVPFIAWVAAALWSLGEWSERNSVLTFGGQVVADSWEVSGTTTGTVKSVRVELYEHVEAGQLLASLDDTVFLAELEASRKELVRLESQVRATQAELQSSAAEVSGDWTSDLRRFQVDVQRLRIEVLDLDLQEKKIQANLRRQQDTQESCSLRLTVLSSKETVAENNLQRLETLSRQGSVAVADADRARKQWLETVNEKLVLEQELRLAIGQIETLSTTLESLKLSGVANQGQLSLAQKRLDEFVSTQPVTIPQLDDPRVKTLKDAVDVHVARLEIFAAQYRALQLHAESAGIVTSILAHPGQSVLPGEPIVLLTKSKATQAIGWLKRRVAAEVILDLEFSIVSLDNKRFPASLEIVAPVFEQMPQVLWMNQNIPEYGQPILLSLPTGNDLLPGEPVLISTLL
jgi:multidrug resistance efflux pump